MAAVVAGLTVNKWVPGARVPRIEPVQPKFHMYRGALNRRSERQMDILVELEGPGDAHCWEDTRCFQCKESCEESTAACNDGMEASRRDSAYALVMENRVEFNRPTLWPPVNPCGCACRRRVVDHVQVVYYDSPYFAKVKDATPFWERVARPERRVVALQRRVCGGCVPGPALRFEVRDSAEAVAAILAAKESAAELMEMDLNALPGDLSLEDGGEGEGEGEEQEGGGYDGDDGGESQARSRGGSSESGRSARRRSGARSRERDSGVALPAGLPSPAASTRSRDQVRSRENRSREWEKTGGPGSGAGGSRA